MPTFAAALPLLPGKTDDWKRMVEEIAGPRRADFEDFHRRVGLTKENWYLQPTPQGDLVIVYLEGEIPQCFQRFATSDHPFDRWFR
jgi:hypothetical protein